MSVTQTVYKWNQTNPNGSVWFHLYTLRFNFTIYIGLPDTDAIKWGSVALSQLNPGRFLKWKFVKITARAIKILSYGASLAYRPTVFSNGGQS